MPTPLTLEDRILVQGFNSELAISGKFVELSYTRESFKALIKTEPSIDPNFPLGSSISEKSVIEALRTSVPKWLLAKNAPSQVAATIGGVKVTLTKREDTIADQFVTFECVKTP